MVECGTYLPTYVGTINNLKGKKLKRIQKKDSPANSSAEDKLLRWVLGVGCWVKSCTIQRCMKAMHSLRFGEQHSLSL